MTRSEGRPEQAPVRIAVDLLGGDGAPAVVVDGALLASSTDPQLSLLLVGPQHAAGGLLSALDPARVEVLPVETGVGMADPAARGGDPGTSIGAATRALAAGRADALISAGGSGATVAAAVMAVGRLPGVRRPALAAVLPGTAGSVVLLDVGAGMETAPRDLLQHALLGIGYAQRMAGVAEPRVGLLSVGTEPGKGDRLRRAVDAALRSHPMPGGTRYIGLVEGGDVVEGGRADVIVTDGFTGNVLLKALEAALGPAAGDGLPRGAVLLGVAAPIVVCHGAATGPELSSGIQLAARLARQARSDALQRPPSGEAAPAPRQGDAPSFTEVPR